MKKTLLSIGMIVKNEERCLEKCLKALEPLRQAISCELVIADTGSTDKTKEIASKYADILFDFEWINDFSAARNAVMDKCSGKWFLTVDADEYLASDTTELFNFFANQSSEEKIFASVIIRNHASKTLNGAYSDFPAVRMVRMNTGIRYSGQIHESFNVNNINDIHHFPTIRFDHDGYTDLSPDFLQKKEQRNLELLEEKLNSSPDNLQIILQCLEATSENQKKKLYYINLAYNLLCQMSPDNLYWNTLAAPCIRQIIIYENHDNSPNLEEKIFWAYKNFPDSKYIIIDVNYIYTRYLFNNKEYKKALKVGYEYLKSYENIEKINTTTNLSDFVSCLLYGSDTNANAIRILVAKTLIEENREKEALEQLHKIDILKTQDNNTIINWFQTAILIKEKNLLVQFFENTIKNIFENYYKDKDSYSEIYNILIVLIANLFSSTYTNEEFKIFKKISNDFETQIKIIESKTKDDVEKYLNQIRNWEEFMPLALKKSISLKADLPSDFFLMQTSHLNLLINKLSESQSEIIDALSEKYCKKEFCDNFPHTLFIFNLLSTILFNNNIVLENNSKRILVNSFNDVADKLLIYLYKLDFLENEEYIVCLPDTHTFAWYLVKANKFKDDNPLEYIKTLRTTLQKVPQAKEIVEFLIEEYKKEEEQKKQEQIKNAAPELIAMAEQLKTMLAAFPENSPELLAIKQSPVYKQVAFLIED